MIYNIGTIAINGNNATGTGTNWTAPASQIRLGQTLVVLSNPVQLFQITAINSSMSLTVTPAASPALTGQKYGILITDSLSVDGLAQSISQLINEYDENIGGWETFATTSANQNITVTINGKAVTIPAIGGLARKGSNSDITELKGLTTALSIAQGGTGATKAEDARSNLGLGDSATKDVGINSGNVLEVGSMGTPSGAYRYYQATQNIAAGVNLNDANAPGMYPDLIDYSKCLQTPISNGFGYLKNHVRISSNTMTQFLLPYATGTADAGRMFYRGQNNNNWAPWKELTTSVISDATMKNIGETLDAEVALSNICRMEFRNFTFKNDDGNTPRRGVISQQIKAIDPEYVKEIGEILHLDTTPMLLDGLAAIQALLKRDELKSDVIYNMQNELNRLRKLIETD